MVDRNLFPYDLAIVAIFKDESPYLREWLDYHLLAGVEHFYLYNNDSSDNFAEVLKPYIDAGLVTLTDWPGKIMQMPAYADALERFRFLCRYMAFVDLDEFILPKTGQSIAEVVDEILSHDEHAAALGINWQHYGSNGHESADLSRGVLERFTRRAPINWTTFWKENGYSYPFGNLFVKLITNPRLTKCFTNPHVAIHFHGFKTISTRGTEIVATKSHPADAEKIVVNHYYTKSREEYVARRINGTTACWAKSNYTMKHFVMCDRNEEFDDDILTYRAARAQNFSLEDDAQRFGRVEKVLVDTLTSQSPFDMPTEFFAGKLETFLTCRKLAEVLRTRIGNRSLEEYALVWIYQTLTRVTAMHYAEVQMFVKALPEIFSRPFPLAKKILQLFRDELIPKLCDLLKYEYQWQTHDRLLELQKFLKLLR